MSRTESHRFLLLEKLVEILRKKVNGATATETVSRICDVLASDVCPLPEINQTEEPANRAPSSSSSSSSSSSEDEEDKAGNGNDNNNNDDIEELDTRSVRNASIASDSKVTLVIDSNVNLSGPVTDL
ncbi:hypothetical protein P5V15_000888 [Pogonomyrmex californicus]